MQIRLAWIGWDVSYGSMITKMMQKQENPSIQIESFLGVQSFLKYRAELPFDGILIDQDSLYEVQLFLSAAESKGRKEPSSQEAEGAPLWPSEELESGEQVYRERDVFLEPEATPEMKELIRLRKIVLSHQLAPDLPMGFDFIYKYQKIEDLYKSLINLFSDALSDQPSGTYQHPTHFVFFSAAAGGAGSTSLAQALSLYLARSRGQQREQVFYLGHDPGDYSFDSPKAIERLGLHPEGDIEDLALALHSRRTNLAVKVKALDQSMPEGTHFILQSPRERMTSLLEEEGLTEFLSFLGKNFSWVLADRDLSPFLEEKSREDDSFFIHRILVVRPERVSLAKALDQLREKEGDFYEAILLNGAEENFPGEEERKTVSDKAQELMLDQLKSKLFFRPLPFLESKETDTLDNELKKVRQLSCSEAFQDLESLMIRNSYV